MVMSNRVLVATQLKYLGVMSQEDVEKVRVAVAREQAKELAEKQAREAPASAAPGAPAAEPAEPAAVAPAEDEDGEELGLLQRTLMGSGSAMALAFIANKALFPVRTPITLMLTPPVARFLKKLRGA